MECPTCGRALNTERGMRQHHTKVHGDPLPNRECKGCGTDFYDPKARRTFCDACNPNAGEHNGNWQDAKERAICTLCEREFDYYPSDKDGVYCGECVADGDGLLPENPAERMERVVTECEQCGDEIAVLESDRERGHGRFCSQDCLYNWMTIEGTPTYNGRWRSVRRRALKRDGYSCQHCGKSKEELGQNPDVHHIKPVRTFEDSEDAHTLENVICLCRSCHVRAEFGNIPLPE